MSRDHDWGCRLTLLVDEDARDQVPRISRMLEEGLPEMFGEFPVRFQATWDPSVSHKVEVATVADFAASRLGVDPTGGLAVLDWLSVTGQSVLEVTAARCSPTGLAPWPRSGRCWPSIRRTSAGDKAARNYHAGLCLDAILRWLTSSFSNTA